MIVPVSPTARTSGIALWTRNPGARPEEKRPETPQQCEQDPGPLGLLAFHWRPSYPRRDEPVYPEDDPRKGSCQEEGIHVRSPYQVHRFSVYGY